ncbi:MAG: glycoside hydrolase family 9 protein [bacterium]|nr:glycoside hydrolase family 9 protein [bacterium]
MKLLTYRMRIIGITFAVFALIIILGILFWSPISRGISYFKNNFAAVYVADTSLIIYNGEKAPLNTDPTRACISYMEEGQTVGRNGSKGLILKPDPWHAPGYKINCGAQGRVDFTPYGWLEFYIKGPAENAGDREFQVISYYGQGAKVNLSTYVQGGIIDNTWRLVSIPISGLQTSLYNLNSVDDLYFGIDGMSRTFYVDDITLTKVKTNVSVTNTTVTPDVVTIFNGDSVPVLTSSTGSCVEYASQLSSIGRNGTVGLKLTPDAYHGPHLKINCGTRDRMNWSGYASLEFYFKSSVNSTADLELNVYSYYGTSNVIKIKPYIEGGVIDTTWRLVSIPISALRTSTYSLDSVDSVFWGKDSSRTFVVDDMVIRKTATVITQPNTAVPTIPTNAQAVLERNDTIVFSWSASTGGTGTIAYNVYRDNVLLGSVSELTITDDALPLGVQYCWSVAAYDTAGNTSARTPNSCVTTLNDRLPPVVSAPEITSVPNVVYGGDINLTINGSDFNLMSNTVTISGSSTFKPVTYTVATKLPTVLSTNFNSTVLPGPGIYSVQVTNINGISNVYPFRVLAATTSAPIITSIADVVLTPGNVNVVITGTGFTSFNSVLITGSTLASFLKYYSYSNPNITVPINSDTLKGPGTYQVYVENENGRSNTVSFSSTLPPPIASVNDTIDMDEIDLANKDGQWLYAENKDYISLNFVKPFDVTKIPILTKYSITSTNDPAYSTTKNPVGTVGYRWKAIYIPTIRKSDLKIAYRLFLKLPTPLQNGKTYTVQVGDIGTDTKPFTFTYNDNAFNQNIQVNQVGYLPGARKIGYVGQYMGTTGAMPFGISTFEVVNANTGTIVSTGSGVLKNANDKYTGQNVYELDFSSLTALGRYYLRIPGVGSSYPFRIGNDVYNEVFSNAFRGIYQQRSGTALTAAYTRFTHPISHDRDAYVIQHNPIPDWFRIKFDNYGDTSKKDAAGLRAYLPTTLSGQFQNSTKGHYDAGDYGKYLVSGAYFIGQILAAYDAFPAKLMKDDMNIPESGNGIPDLLDEAKWELDWVENMQDPVDGGVFCIVKPDGAIEFYEARALGAASPSTRLLYPKDTTCTGAYAGVMAKAANSTVIKQYYPVDAVRYLEKAKKAWVYLERNAGYLGWHHYGAKSDEVSTDKSFDDRVWAAIELYNATGEAKYNTFYTANAQPEWKHWSWEPLWESNGQSTYACAFSQRTGLDANLKTRCRNAIVAAGNQHVNDSNARSYHLSLSTSALDNSFGYMFPQTRILALLMANAISPNITYLQTALYNWDYVLGSNPTGYSLMTGIGSKRYRDVVSDQSVHDLIVSPVPGIPIGLSNRVGGLTEYGSAKFAQAPSTGYPALMHYYDGWNVGVEFTTPEVSENLISAAYFTRENEPRNAVPSSLNVTATPIIGAVPLSVNFNATASDIDGGIVKYRWDFDDEGFSNKQNPTHVFTDAYRVYKVVVTATDNDGAESYKEILIQTKPALSLFSGVPYTNDANTLGLFHFDTSVRESSGKAMTFSLQNGTKISANNLLWMTAPTGQALEFATANDTATLSFVPPSSTSTMAVEGKIYIDTHSAFNVVNATLFALTQGDSKYFGLFDQKYVDGTYVKSAQGYDATQQSILLTKNQLVGKLDTKKWYLFKLLITGGKASVYIDGVKLAETSIQPNFSTASPVTLKVGGFKGFIDEVRISNVTR